MKILYQGFPGAYSHLAAQEVFPEIEVMPCNTFEDCLLRTVSIIASFLLKIL